MTTATDTLIAHFINSTAATDNEVRLALEAVGTADMRRFGSAVYIAMLQARKAELQGRVALIEAGAGLQ